MWTRISTYVSDDFHNIFLANLKFELNFSSAAGVATWNYRCRGVLRMHLAPAATCLETTSIQANR
jgi:hypothetical protein